MSAIMVEKGITITCPDLPEDERPTDLAPIIPITIKRMEMAQRLSRDGRIRLHGFSPKIVIIFGVVEKVWWDREVRKLILNDSTGRTYVRLIQGPGNRLNGPLRGQYVMLAGSPYRYWTGVGWDFEAYCSRRATADEVSYHTIESVHALLSLQRRRDELDLEDTTTIVVPPEAVERRSRRSQATSSQDP